ncbi:DUF3108 domain-containing protein [Aerolutibacter ruishenii]|uniref:Uncharacterized protein DUF3108 n=1 Tax=Aerolutibacter ruishenii TaxID=686800 RepID=A0A562LPE5_9GAMM|nr:DUF3108 domain-containing protein [Lysobacter ruishenii]TWI09475.1 uncharacterized protein DUF3108 [Lysobacter ruishenii]
MTRIRPITVFAALIVPLSSAIAQPATPAAAPAASEAQAPLEPFVAQYKVYKGTRELGDATLQLVRQPGDRWRVDLLMRGAGVFRIAGVHADQSTVFDVSATGKTYRPLTQATVRRLAFTRRQTIGLYDWNSRSAHWTGDVKASRSRPVALQPGDMSGLLINLAVIRDAAPGKALHYRFVDDGRVRDHQYQVAGDVESMGAGDMRFDTLRVGRTGHAHGDETLLWVADGVPTPVRILQRENGQDTYDLRLVEYKGIQ